MRETIVDIGVRLLIRVPSYQHAGQVMDNVQEAVSEVLEHADVPARFDFTHINTRPCKAAQMEALAVNGDPELAPPGPDSF